MKEVNKNMVVVLRLLKQLFILIGLCVILWMLLPRITGKEIKNDRPFSTKVICLVVCIAGLLISIIAG